MPAYCHKAISEAFHIEGYNRCIAAKKPYLRPINIQRRLDWAI